MDPFIYVYSYMDPLWTHSYTFIHIWTHYGPIHISVFIYGPIKDPLIYVYSYMDPSWTHYGPIMDPFTNKQQQKHPQAFRLSVTSGMVPIDHGG